MEEKVSARETSNHTQKEQRRPEVLLALIEHGSRPAAFALIGLFITIWLFSVKGTLQKVSLASFEVELHTVSTSANLNKELNALAELNDEQLQLFLVLGKEREYINYNGEEVNEENLGKLYEVGLLKDWQTTSEGGFSWTVSKNGNRLHDILRNLIYSSIRRSAT